MSSLWVILKKTGFNSLSRSTKGSIHWDIFEKEGSILRVILKKRNSSLSHFEKNVQIFESHWEKGSILWVILRNGSILWVIFKTSPILWVTFKKKDSFLRVKLKKRFNSVRHIREKRCSILCVIFEKRDVQFCASYSRKEMFNSVRHILLKKMCHIFQKTINLFFESYIVSKRNILWVKLKKETFFESCWKGSISKNHVFLKGFNFDPILWVILKKVQKDWILRVNHICEKGLSVRVCKKSSILRVIFLFTIINSLGQHFQRKDHYSLSQNFL